MCLAYLTSSIGRKAVMAVTGLILFGFVVAHMLGNLQIFLGPEALNSYAEHLEELPALLWPARVILLISLLLHILTAVTLAHENKRARPVGYKAQGSVQITYASRTMVMSGLIVFAFIVYHLAHFTFGVTHPQYSGLLDAKGRHDVYAMVVMSFREPTVALPYTLAMFVLSAHLRHGVQSVFQTLGLSNENTRRGFDKLAVAAALLIFIGNTSIVACSYFGVFKTAAGS